MGTCKTDDRYGGGGSPVFRLRQGPGCLSPSASRLAPCLQCSGAGSNFEPKCERKQFLCVQAAPVHLRCRPCLRDTGLRLSEWLGVGSPDRRGKPVSSRIPCLRRKPRASAGVARCAGSDLISDRRARPPRAVDMVVRALEGFRSGDAQVFLYNLDHPPTVSINRPHPCDGQALLEHAARVDHAP